MCSCSSCTETDRFSGLPDLFGKERGLGKFSAWPRGNAAGIARSKADYAAHVACGKSGGVERAIPAFTIKPEPHFSTLGLTPSLPSPSALVRNWIASSYAWADGRNAFPGPDVKPVRKSTRPLLALAQELRRAA